MLGFLNFTFIDLLDILMVAAIIYLGFRWIRGTTAINIFIAIILVLVIQVIATALGMKMISSILGTVVDVGAIALIIIFQPELRRFLGTVGRKAGKSHLLARFFSHKSGSSVNSDSIQEISQACSEMSDHKTGALILIQREDSLEDIVATGDVIDAQISSRLIMNIFFKNSPLHDGAMIIEGNRIAAARCTLPITAREDLPARFGMRHKAAVGASEGYDALVIVVSEETGGISVVRGGELEGVDSIATLKLILSGKA